MRRRGQHWVTAQLRRALFEFAHATEVDLTNLSTENDRRDVPLLADRKSADASIQNRDRKDEEAG